MLQGTKRDTCRIIVRRIQPDRFFARLLAFCDSLIVFGRTSAPTPSPPYIEATAAFAAEWAAFAAVSLVDEAAKESVAALRLEGLAKCSSSRLP